MTTPASSTRRKFFKQCSAAGAALGFPTFIPATALGKNGAVAPSNRTTLALIGCGGRGTDVVKNFLQDERVQVMAVCDVSRSVSQHARFLLLFLHGLQEVIPRLRSFAFSSTLHEVTALFDSMAPEAAIEAVMDRHGFGSTDYGRAFSDLDRLALRDIDHRTTLIILGDARNNNGEARTELLQQFHARARQVIWLNPERPNRWGSGDSEMLRYRAACTRVHSCRNLGDLERIVDRLLKSARAPTGGTALPLARADSRPYS